MVEVKSWWPVQYFYLVPPALCDSNTEQHWIIGANANYKYFVILRIQTVAKWFVWQTNTH